MENKSKIDMKKVMMILAVSLIGLTACKKPMTEDIISDKTKHIDFVLYSSVGLVTFNPILLSLSTQYGFDLIQEGANETKTD